MSNYDAPKGFCDKHGTGYFKSLGCLDCNAKHNETKAIQSNKLVNEVVSVKTISHAELMRKVGDGTEVAIVKSSLTDCIIVLNNKAYLFVSNTNPNILYFKVNEQEAIELTLNLEFKP